MIVSKEDVLTQLLALLPPPLTFGRIPKCFGTAVWTFLSSKFWTQDHMYMLCYLIVIFYSLFGWLTANYAPLERGQLHSPDVSHYVFIIFLSEGQWKPRNYDFFKTGDRLHTDGPIQRLTCRQTDRHKKVKI